jgi:hypothetical protein
MLHALLLLPHVLLGRRVISSSCTCTDAHRVGQGPQGHLQQASCETEEARAGLVKSHPQPMQLSPNVYCTCNGNIADSMHTQQLSCAQLITSCKRRTPAQQAPPSPPHLLHGVC